MNLIILNGLLAKECIIFERHQCTFMWYRIIKQITNVKWIRHENKLQLFRLIGITRPCALLTALRKRAKWRQRSSFGQSLVQSLQMTTISGQKSESFYLPPSFLHLFFPFPCYFWALPKVIYTKYSKH